MIFYLGTHRPLWLGRTDTPLFVSRRTLCDVPNPPKALGCWALDSGGFSELSMYGGWKTSSRRYINEVRQWRDTIGGLKWAAIQDWMCEPFILEKTGKTVAEHQARTIDSYLTLLSAAPDLPWVPVVQGWQRDDYLKHVEDYAAAGVPLTACKLVGVGSVCRRQKTEEALDILRSLHALGLILHGFGFKIDGLWNGGVKLLASADSMAWSRGARYEPSMMGCTHKTCANCMKYALRWRESVLNAIVHGERHYQPTLFV